MVDIKTSVMDTNGNVLRVGDKVRLFNQVGEVSCLCGAYGILFPFDAGINWSCLEKMIPEITGTDNPPHFCYHDFFVSFWELIWNYNLEEDCCDVVEKIEKEVKGE